ncbi:polysaccharide deacetylase family protein [Burkholderiaceae bacterium UC74_6]
MSRLVQGLALGLLALISGGAARADCGPDALGTSRVITLPRAAAAYGTFQHAPLPSLAPGEVVLTFDDGPRPESTPLVLKALDAQCVKASFFLIGSEMLRSPDLARQVLKAGHAVGGHGFQHDHFPQLKDAEQLGNLKLLQLSFQTVFGFAPAAWRFPYFEESQPLMGELQKQGFIVLSADLAIDDWLADQSPAMLEARMLERLREKKGGIVLMHDAQDQTARALPQLLAALKREGYKVVQVRWD